MLTQNLPYFYKLRIYRETLALEFPNISAAKLMVNFTGQLYVFPLFATRHSVWHWLTSRISVGATPFSTGGSFTGATAEAFLSLFDFWNIIIVIIITLFLIVCFVYLSLFCLWSSPLWRLLNY